MSVPSVTISKRCSLAVHALSQHVSGVTAPSTKGIGRKKYRMLDTALLMVLVLGLVPCIDCLPLWVLCGAHNDTSTARLQNWHVSSTLAPLLADVLVSSTCPLQLASVCTAGRGNRIDPRCRRDAVQLCEIAKTQHCVRKFARIQEWDETCYTYGVLLCRLCRAMLSG
jgi:hypothetical protein